MEQPLFFKDWAELGGAAAVAVTAYTGFIILLRGSGKRTLTKMNVFDFVFVVALGSMMATTILSPDVTAAKGIVGCATLIVFQMLLSWATTQSKKIDHLINGVPTLLLFRGQFLIDVMKRERVTEAEIRAAIRIGSLASVDDVEAVVLETDGTFAVVWRSTEGTRSALSDLAGQENRGRRKSADTAA